MSTRPPEIGRLSGPVVLTASCPGTPIIPSPSPLTFLSCYGGRVPPGSDLRREQLAMQRHDRAVQSG